MKLLARDEQVMVFGKGFTHKTERNNVLLVLSDGLTTNAIGNGILQSIIRQ